MRQLMKSIAILLGLLIMAIAITACTESEPAAREITDREGYAVTLPPEINTVLALGPSNAEILVAMGQGHKIIAVDAESAGVPGLPAGISTSLSFWVDIDAEYVIELMPDVVFVTGLTRAGGTDPLYIVSLAGIPVIYMPTADSINAIMEDIRFIAYVMDAQAEGEAIIATMQAEIDEIAAIAATITTTRTVYFEVSPAPWMFSFGTGTFLHEMIELVGATNIFAGQSGWVPVSEEVLLEANPDVILTSTDFLDDPIAEIAERPGFDTITAVQNGHIFQIDTNSSNRPSQNITRALAEMAAAIFPEYFQ